MEIDIFKTDEEVERILTHKDNKVNHKTIGKGNGRVNIPETYTPRPVEEKANIGVLATLIGNKAAAELTGVQPSQVSKYKNGVKNTIDSVIPDKELRSELSNRLDPIRNKAIDKVSLFLEMLTPEKMTKMKGRDMASSAKSLVEVYDKLGPKVDNPLLNAKTVIFYSPKVKESHDYPVINVEAN